MPDYRALANVIGAAPDMYAALEQTVELFESWRDGVFKTLGVHWINEPPAIIAARAALAKARGEK